MNISRGDRHLTYPRKESSGVERNVTAGLARLKGVILLGGSLRPTPLAKAVGRSILDLPVETNTSVLELWCDHISSLAKELGGQHFDARLLLDSEAPFPTTRMDCESQIEIGRDPQAYRGTAGILRDLAESYADSDLLLVASAGQVLLAPLAHLTRVLAESAADVGIISNPDGTPASLFLVKCGALRDIARVGFIDFKEQALPRIAQSHFVKPITWNQLFSVPIRTADGYLTALRHHRNVQRGIDQLNRVFSEEWSAAFSVVESGARVDSSAHLHDSVVLKGGRVEEGAAVFGSIICAGGIVRPGQQVIGEMVMEETSMRC